MRLFVFFALVPLGQRPLLTSTLSPPFATYQVKDSLYEVTRLGVGPGLRVGREPTVTFVGASSRAYDSWCRIR